MEGTRYKDMLEISCSHHDKDTKQGGKQELKRSLEIVHSK